VPGPPLDDPEPSPPPAFVVPVLNRRMQPGAYTLEVVLLDQLRKSKDAAAIQWIDFELVGEPAGAS
jgi:hypothetical protein